ncbi:MAG: HAD-IIB family hydrolase [Gammaproteobacteria bacterium]
MRENKKTKYLVLISIHGLMRGHDLELGRDADTGGQTKYVVDLARALAENDDVERVDLITRRIVDVNVSDDYAVPIEVLSDKVRIIRIDAGPEEYIPKEQLWDHLDSFMDNLVTWLNTQPRMPDLVHSHYADSGYVGVRLTNLLGVPLIHTGHSLGRDKRKRLLATGLSTDEIDHVYNMVRRTDAEEEILANADLVIASTHNEIDAQYGLYNYYEPDRMSVIPPGTDLTLFHPPQVNNEQISFSSQLPRFLNEPDKPIILALSRPDERKNILTLIKVFGESQALQEVANLLIVAGNRDDIRDMEIGAQTVLTNVLLLIDSYDLYGKVAVPKAHSEGDVPKIFRLVASSQGVFINPALTEPFGLTLLEAAASGLPVVATENGGPVDIIENCKNGELIDPLDKSAMTEALLKLLKNKNRWLQAAKNGIEGVTKHYSWRSHVKIYLEKIDGLSAQYQPIPQRKLALAARYRDRAIFTDLDKNLMGDSRALQHFVDVIKENRKCVSFGIVTGRRIDSALALMKSHNVPVPDVLITSLGTRIHYGQNLTEDNYWADHIDHYWSRQRIQRIIAGLPGLEMQPKSEQTAFKLSYYYNPEIAPTVEEIVSQLQQKDITANVMLSYGHCLDIVPSRASKGQALRYVVQRFGIPLEHSLVVGGSGVDEDMMRGNTLAVVVGNRQHEELSQLVEQEKIYFANQPHALGILEAIDYYDFFHACKVPGV